MAFSFFLLLAIGLREVSAASVFLTPSSMQFEDVYYYGYYEKNITISTDSESDIACAIEIQGDIKDVIILSDNICAINKDSPITVVVTAKPKGKVGTISGYIRVTVLSAEPLTTTTDYFDMKVDVNSINRKIIQNEIKDIVVSDTEINAPTDLTVIFDNKGNVELSPKIHIEIFSAGRIVDQYDFTETIAPRSERQASFSMPLALQKGGYTAKIKIEQEGAVIAQKEINFAIYDKNTLLRKGRFSIVTQNSHINKTNAIEVNFENLGQIALNPRFIGAVYYENSSFPVENIETQAFFAPRGRTTSIAINFTPEEIGNYKVVGHISYENTDLPDQESLFEVKLQTEALGFESIAIIILIVLALIVTRQVVKEKTEKK